LLFAKPPPRLLTVKQHCGSVQKPITTRRTQLQEDTNFWVLRSGRPTKVSPSTKSGSSWASAPVGSTILKALIDKPA
jgi:hypothetical protein